MIVDLNSLPPVGALPTTSGSFGGPTKSVAPVPTVNPLPSVNNEFAGEAGHRTLWVVFVIMLAATVAFTALSFRVKVERRFFHIITAFITLFATISYFAMATGDGISVKTVTIEHKHKKDIPSTYEEVNREVYWARYVDWSVTTPLLLLDLSLLAGLNGASIFIAIVADLVMVLTGLFAAFGTSEGQKWGYYAMGCAAYLVIVYQLALNGRKAVQGKEQKTATLFISLAGFTALLWTAYPVVWGVADGSRQASVDAEIISYAILDVLAKPIFGFWLLLSHDFSGASSLSMGGFWAHGPSAEGAISIGDDEEGA